MKFDGILTLVVEDHDFQRRFVIDRLKRLGIQSIHEADNGSKALERLKEASYNLIILDIQLPEMDGIEFLRRLSDMNFQGAVILVSSLETTLLGSIENMAKVYKLNVLGRAEKPVDIRQLEKLLSKLEDTETQGEAGAQDSLPTKEDIEDALKEQQFVMHFQPQVSFLDKSLQGLEALARWHHSEKGWIPPNYFIPIMEEHGLLDRFTDFALDQALTVCRDLLDRGSPIPVSVNVSPSCLKDVDVAQRYADMVSRENVPPELITFEVTEQSIVLELAQSIENLARLRMNHFRLAIDDFGVGYSTMQQLSRLPFTELKIDRSFINGCMLDMQLQAIVESSLDLAHKLRMRVVAEGVETLEDWTFLKAKHCDVCQGYFAAKPMPANELAAWEKDWRERSVD